MAYEDYKNAAPETAVESKYQATKKNVQSMYFRSFSSGTSTSRKPVNEGVGTSSKLSARRFARASSHGRIGLEAA